MLKMSKTRKIFFWVLSLGSILGECSVLQIECGYQNLYIAEWKNDHWYFQKSVGRREPLKRSRLCHVNRGSRPPLAFGMCLLLSNGMARTTFSIQATHARARPENREGSGWALIHKGAMKISVNFVILTLGQKVLTDKSIELSCFWNQVPPWI